MKKDPRYGHIDYIKDGYVHGWAIDAFRGNNAASLFLFLDDKPVANFFCDIDRPDLESAGLRRSQAGFRFPVPEQYLDGEPHTISIRFHSGEYLLFSDREGGMAKSAVLRMHMPVTLSGCVDGLTHGALRGWAVRQDHGSTVKQGGVDMLVLHDGVEVGRVKTDKYRADVAKALGCDPHCGFMFRPPARFRDGRSYTFEFNFAATGQSLEGSPVSFEYPAHLSDTRVARLHNVVEEMSTQLWRLKRELKDMMSERVFMLADYDPWVRQYHAALRYRRRQTPWPANRPQPLVSILCPVYRPRMTDFVAAIESVLAQTYPNWELILVDDCSKSKELTAAIAELCARDRRIRAVSQKKNTGISGATNTAIAAAKGEYIALFDHDDLLLDVAVEIMMEAALKTGAKMLYSDEDKIDDFGRYSDPNLKGDWNHRLVLGQNYVCHFLVVEAATLRAVGRLRSEYDGAQDHDLVLRLSEIVEPARIVHVPEVIYHWRKTPGSTATVISAKSYAIDAGAMAVRDHLQRLGREVKVSPMLGVTVYQVDWGFQEEPSVTVIIPFREQLDVTRLCLDRLLSVTEYKNFEVVLVDNWSTSREAAAFAAKAQKHDRVRVIRVEEAFNYSRLNNIACLQCSSEYFVFMNNDVFVEQPNWLRLLVDEALADKTVGAVGAKLVFPDRTVQHGGVFLGVGGVGDHANRGRAIDDPFYMGRGICAQELSAVTAALMLCRADVFQGVGGFDETDLSVAYNDVDLCLKLRRAGFKVIYCPYVVAEHHESVSRGDDMNDVHLGRFVYEEQVMLTRWGPEIRNDPFYNPNFSNAGGLFQELSVAALRPPVAEEAPRMPEAANRLIRLAASAD
jgi:GT2 family glycosyltransferase